MNSVRGTGKNTWNWIRNGAIPWVRELAKEFNSDNGTLVAAALSFYTFLAVFPLLLVAIAVSSYFLGSADEASQLILDTTKRYAVGGEARSMLESAVQGVIAGRGTATGIGLILLLWSGSTIIVVLQKAMNVIWDVEEERGFVKQRLLALGFLLLLGTVIILSFAATTFANYLASADAPILPDMSWIAKAASYVVPLLISVLAFSLIYKLLPNTKVRWKVALVGGVVAGVLWEIAKIGFTYYVVNFANYNAVYGSLGGIILFLIWVNYSAIIVILGGEVSSMWSRKHRESS